MPFITFVFWGWSDPQSGFVYYDDALIQSHILVHSYRYKYAINKYIRIGIYQIRSEWSNDDGGDDDDDDDDHM